MLKEYKKTYTKAIIQFLILSDQGMVLESDDVLFSNITNNHISDLHPFFESLIPLLSVPNKESFFSCIHLEINNKSFTTDVILKTFKKGEFPLVVIHDLTSHYITYQKTAQVRNEAAINAQIIKLKNDYLKEKEEFKNSFLANFSNELKTPLSNIVSFSTLLKHSTLNQSQLYNLDIIKTSGEHLRNIIDDILDISKIEMSKLKIQNSPFNIYSIFEYLNDIYTVKSEEKRISFSYEIDPEIPPFITGDKFRLTQILTNLLNNAFKFTQEGSVSLKTKLLEQKGDVIQLEFIVHDTGIGIPKEKIKTAFKSFSQLHPSGFGGTGLGLSIVKQLVTLMNGNIGVTSTVNKETIFTISLNFNVSKEQPQESISNLNSKNGSKTKTTHNILVAENLEINQYNILKILSKNDKYAVDIVNDGDQVIESLYKKDYDLVLMNLKIPKMDGYDTTRFIRYSNVDKFKNIPIIALTDRPTKDERERCLTRGMNDYIAKPLDDVELMTKIKKVLRKKAGEKESP